MSQRRTSSRVPDVSQAKSWPASKINTTLDRMDRLQDANADAFISAGRGHERPSEYLKQHDPLSRQARAIWEAKTALRNEISMRYGPGAPSRLPRGFGPIKGAMGLALLVGAGVLLLGGGIAWARKPKKKEGKSVSIGEYLDLLDAEFVGCAP